MRDLRVALLTQGFSYLMGGPRLFHYFANELCRTGIPADLHTLESHSGDIDVPGGDARVITHRIGATTGGTSRLDRSRQSIIAALRDLAHAPCYNPKDVAATMTCRMEPFRSSLPESELTKLMMELSLSYDAVHLAGALLLAPFYTRLAKRKLSGNARFLCHAFVHPPRYLTSYYSVGRLAGIIDRCWHESLWSVAAHTLRQFDAVTTSTPFEAQQLRSLGCNAHFVGEGIDSQRLSQNALLGQEIASAWREKWTYPRLLLLSRSMIKGYGHVVLAVEKLRREGFRGTLVCGGRKPPTAPNPISPLQRSVVLAEQVLRREKILIDVGYLSEIEKAAAFSASDIVVMPSAVETVPLVFLESWFFGKPVIGANVPTVRSVVGVEGKGGLLAEYGSIDSIAKCIRYLASSEANAQQIGRLGREKLQVYNLEAAASRLSRVYEEIAGQ